MTMQIGAGERIARSKVVKAQTDSLMSSAMIGWSDARIAQFCRQHLKDVTHVASVFREIIRSWKSGQARSRKILKAYNARKRR